MSTVQSIERAFAILQVVAAHPEGVGVTAVSQQVDLHKSTVSRLLATLEGVGAVERVPESNLFRIGSSLLSLISQVPFHQQLITLASPFLHQLTAQFGEDSGLCVPDGDQVLQIDQVRGQQQIQVRNWIGERYPLHTSVAGKLFLAFFAEERRERYLGERPLIRYASQTYTDPDQLRPHLLTIRQQGYSWVLDEFADGLAGLAVPIFDGNNQIVAAVTIYGPSFRFPGDNRAAVLSLALDAGKKMTDLLRQSNR